jgi:iron complex outermembrane receptor protein
MHVSRLLLPILLASVAVPMEARAQRVPGAEDAGDIIVTGSRIRQRPEDSALPLQIFSQDDLRRESINSPEQFIAFLTANGTGLDNLASNADVVSGHARGNNGASSANLRG